MRATDTINLGNLLLSLSDVVDLADPSIAAHQQRAAYIAWEISMAAGMSEKQLKDIFAASLLHDIGIYTVEEKLALHDYRTFFEKSHCVKREILLRRIPEFDSVSSIIRFHHSGCEGIHDPADDYAVKAAQVVHLADFIERLMRRDLYILHQSDDIIGCVNALQDSCIDSELTKAFIDTSRRDEFWLDLTSPRIYSLLFNNGPLHDTEISYTELENILIEASGFNVSC